MKIYKNLAGNVGVCAYEFRDNSIRIKFHTRKVYIYDHKYTGEEHVDKMKTLAIQGHGLNNYINEHVIDKYAAYLD